MKQQIEIIIDFKNEIGDIIETYFKKWNGNDFDRPTYLEKQKHEACAEAISNMIQLKIKEL